jgi:phosphoglucomutase
MPLSPLAGKPPPADLLIDPAAVVAAYAGIAPDLADPLQRVVFGTSGHRGSPLDGSFNEAHILAITQAICELRAAAGVDGPLFLVKDTHAADAPAHDTAIEVLAGNGVTVLIAPGDEPTPVPLLSHAILARNRGRSRGLADGIAVTPSHNPPRDGGFKYNPTHGGPADTQVTRVVQERANALLRAGNAAVRRVPLARAVAAGLVRRHDFVTPYVDDLAAVVDLEAVRASGLRIAADPLGGAAVHCWGPIRDRYRLDLVVLHDGIDPTFRFMRVDHDGRIRMDCSSPYAMAGLVELADRYDLAIANDTDADRHGIVTPAAGLMPPNHVLAVASDYLFANRRRWRADAMVGKTVVSSAIIDRAAATAGRHVFEVPVGFKWFVDGLGDGSLGFAGEESAGATLLRRDGTAWTTDKDGLVIGLLACEIAARSGKDPGACYRDLERRCGPSFYRRDDRPATPHEREALARLQPDAVRSTTLAGDPITAVLTAAPGNHAAIGGLKVATANGWFAVRPSGTEPICKLYGESLVSAAHLESIMEEAQAIVDQAVAAPAEHG